MKKIMRKIKNKFYIDNSLGEKEINKQVIIIIVSVIATVLSTIGVTFAAFVWSDTSEKEQNVVVGNLNLTISEESDALGKNLDVPIPDEKVDELTPYKFTVTNNGDVDAYFKLKIADDTNAITSDSCNNTQIDKTHIGIKVTGGNNLTGLLSEYINNPIDFGVLGPQESKTYSVYLWLKNDSPNSVIGKHYHGKILLETEQTIDNEKRLADSILTNEKENIKTDNPQFTDTSQDKGLYKLQGDIAKSDDGSTKDIYYYRGAVDNNYVQFGTYTKEVKNMINNEKETVAKAGDQILWRIVRINEDGSVKLIADLNIEGDTSEGYHVWNSKGTSDYEGSEIKTTVDNWYKETFVNPTGECQNNKELEKLIQKTEFCNDRSDEYNGVYNRLYANPPQPTLYCVNKNDIITDKVGLITADEMIYAGTLYMAGNTFNNTTYLNNDTLFWTLSPKNNSEVIHYRAGNDLDGHYVARTAPVSARPVITLSANASVTTDFLSEDKPGTINNPYKVVVK